jgi:hypothetical protein
MRVEVGLIKGHTDGLAERSQAPARRMPASKLSTQNPATRRFNVFEEEAGIYPLS